MKQVKRFWAARQHEFSVYNQHAGNEGMEQTLRLGNGFSYKYFPHP